MSEKFSITNSTTVSVGILLTIIGGTFFIARLEASSNQNSKDITALTDSIEKRIEVDNKQNDITQELNENIIRLNARLDAESSVVQQSIPVVSSRSTDRVVVVNSSGMQPTGQQQNTVQPGTPYSPPPSTPQPEEPESTEQPGILPGAAETLLNTILKVVRL
jgi:predicted amidohydrolase YtcJ